MLKLVRIISALILCSSVLLSGISSANQNVESNPISSYDQGQYSEAINQYQQLLKQNPLNGHLYYNLGAAYYRLEQRGFSVAAYLEARRLLPRDPDVAANLSLALKENKSNLKPSLKKSLVSKIFFWSSRVTVKELAYGAVFLLSMTSLFALFFLVFRRKKGLNTSLNTSLTTVLKNISFALLAATLLVSFALTISLTQQEHWGAVTTSVAQVKSGPGIDNAVVFELREGAPFVARRQENSWYQIELSDGKIGWISTQDSNVYNF
jgi:tetratricopeptide (TPR) repeat protein